MTSPFKRAVESDILRVFINSEEFGESFVVNGRTVMGVFDYDEEKDIRARSSMENPEGVYQNEYSFFVKESELGFVPRIGSRLDISGSTFQVTFVDRPMGVLNIKMFEVLV